ncbi:hypothetical protein FLL45_06465 [Aliikangiella marina]|uniref:Serine aminopeptidase S33 domain-containing protein n=1 Tax=Aliikangiella marina TaxID=1712262 RepID=A0A545TBJ9_9GAMM|nr:alpha/beta fold hydrolase [Aliikangiella marina]TQV74603.1 hypothetical protein FLL45_06465 [Aliikangiella marina]
MTSDVQTSIRNQSGEAISREPESSSKKVEQNSFAEDTRQFAEKRFKKIKRLPFYFGENERAMLGWLHFDERVKQSDTCVLICPPLGLEYMNTYRSLRYLADYFALAGIPALRFDYYGTGDSSGFNIEGNRLVDWTEAIIQSKDKVKSLTGAKKVAVFGLGIGGTIAASAPFNEIIDYLILWGTPDRGKRFVREIKALQMTSAIDSSDLESGRIEAGGMIYWPETIDAFGQINLQQSKPHADRVLLLERDDVPVMKKLASSWASMEDKLEVKVLDGFSDMLQNAHLSLVPHSALQEIASWLKAKSNLKVELTSHQIEAMVRDQVSKQVFSIPNNAPSNIDASPVTTTISERFFRFGKNDKGFGIVASPEETSSDLPKIVLLNSGATHRVAPGRLYVLLSRQLAKCGFDVFRVDLPGLGDSQINDRDLERIEYPDEPSEKIESIIKAIEKQYPGSQFIVMGLCSGAYHSFKYGMETTRSNILESVLINPLVFYWDKRASVDSFARNFSDWNDFKLALTNIRSWKRFLKFEINIFAKIKIVLIRMCVKLESLMRRMIGQASEASDCGNTGDLNKDLNAFINKGIKLSFFFSREDPGYDLLTTSANITAPKLIKAKKIDVSFVEKADHTFSKFKPKHKVIELIVKHLVERYNRK